MMKREVGDPQFPIWLLGDSEPDRWRADLATPLDPRHPIRHNIWSSILDVTQRDVFAALRRRLDAEKAYIRNAVEDPASKPSDPFNEKLSWHQDAQASLADYQQLIVQHRPRFLISFGYFAFAFALRSVGEYNRRGSNTGSQSGFLGTEFRKRAASFDIAKTNVFPLLHRSIAGGHFLSGHNEFCGTRGANYFEEAGKVIAAILIGHHGVLDCWAEPPSPG